MNEISYTLTNYTDVWGNFKDGYEVNDSCVFKHDLILPYDYSDKKILTLLKNIKFLSTDDMRKVYLHPVGERIEILAKKENFPFGHLNPNY